MGIYFSEKMSNQKSLFLSWNDPQSQTNVGRAGDTSLTLIKLPAPQAAR